MRSLLAAFLLLTLLTLPALAGPSVVRADIGIELKPTSISLVSKSLKVVKGDPPEIHLAWAIKGLKKGDEIVATWIAVKVADVEPNLRIEDGAVEATEPDMHGRFTLSRPTAGWPKGKYKVVLKVGGKKLHEVPFKLE